MRLSSEAARTACSLTLASLLVFFARPAGAAWIDGGTPVGFGLGDQVLGASVPDGVGGAVIIWSSGVTTGNADVYAQRMDMNGDPMWTPGGVPICTATGDQVEPVIAPDGFGGYLITWEDDRDIAFDADIWAQRIDENGTATWSTNGVEVATDPGDQDAPNVVRDENGGAYITWQDVSTGNLYAQRLDGFGARQWPGGVGIQTLGGTVTFGHDMAVDGAGGVIVAWSDDRFVTDSDVFITRLDVDGDALWARNLTGIVDIDERTPELVSDGHGGAYVVWRQGAPGLLNSVRARRVDSQGLNIWSGAAVLSDGASVGHLELLRSDGDDLIATWVEDDLSQASVRAQRCGAVDGALRWSVETVLDARATGNVMIPKLVTDAHDGAIVTWKPEFTTEFIVAQRLDAQGAALLGDGSPVTVTTRNNSLYPEIVSAGAGAAIVAWTDLHTGHGDVVAQRLEPSEGAWGRPEPILTSVADVPGDQGGVVRVSWEASGHDAIPFETITHYSVWRATGAARGNLSSVEPLPLIGLGDVGLGFEGPAVRRSAGGFYWEYVGQQQAVYAAAYSFATATEADSTGVTPALHYFQVFAHAGDTFTAYPSAPDSGYSVDNLSPAPPQSLAAERSIFADVTLTWRHIDEETPDFAQYAIYRDTAPGVPVDDEHLIASTTDSTFVDDTALPTEELFYVVVAVDVHENASAPSNEAMVTTTTDVEPTPDIGRFQLSPNVPNPFRAETSMFIGLPATGDVHLDVYDVSGRRVATRMYTSLGPGSHRVTFDGRDDHGRALRGGVYFVTANALGETRTRKVTMAR